VEAVARGDALAQRAHQLGQVAGALAQRGHAHPHHVEAVEQIGAKGAATHLDVEVALGGGHHPGAEGAGLAAAQTLELAVLQHAQQPCLQCQRQLADLVEEERALARALEAPQPTGRRPGEGASLVAKELALEERGGETGAVEVHEGSPAPPRAPVQPARQQAFAHAGLAHQQHADIEGRRSGELIEHTPHGLTNRHHRGILRHVG